MTAKDLMAVPDDAWHYELVRGRLVRMQPTGFEHGALGFRLGAALVQFADERELGAVVGPKQDSWSAGTVNRIPSSLRTLHT